LASTGIRISIYNAKEGSYFLGNITDKRNDLTLWGENNYPGAYNIYMKDIAGNPGVMIEHPLSDIYKNLQVLEAYSFRDFDSAKKPHSELYIYSDYDRIVTGAIIDSIIIKKIK
jgi:hypothetical protein